MREELPCSARAHTARGRASPNPQRLRWPRSCPYLADRRCFRSKLEPESDLEVRSLARVWAQGPQPRPVHKPRGHASCRRDSSIDENSTKPAQHFGGSTPVTWAGGDARTVTPKACSTGSAHPTIHAASRWVPDTPRWSQPVERPGTDGEGSSPCGYSQSGRPTHRPTNGCMTAKTLQQGHPSRNQDGALLRSVEIHRRTGSESTRRQAANDNSRTSNMNRRKPSLDSRDFRVSEGRHLP